MSRWLVDQSLKLRFLVVALAALLVAFGVARLPGMPVDSLPEVGQPVLEIQTEALGLSTTEVEELVTINVEELVIQTPWLLRMSSQSLPGVSRILLEFEPGTDMMRARQAVQERLAGSWALPNVGKPPVLLQPVSATRRSMMIGLSSKTVNPIDLSVLARWTIAPRLMGIKGVANVTIWAQRNKQLHVQVDPERLRSHDVKLDEVVRASGDALWVSPLSFLNASMPGTGGWLETPNQRLAIRHELPISTPEQLAAVTLQTASGKPLRLGDVTTVVEGHPPLIGEAVLGEGPGLLLVVEKLPDASALQVTKDVDAALAALQQGLPGIDIDSNLYRSASYLEEMRANVGPLVVAGLVLAILLIALATLSIGAALVALATMVLSMVAAVAVLYFDGATFTMMTLAGLAAASLAVVDDAVVALGALARARRKDGLPVAEAFVAGRRPLAAATLVTLLAAVPLLFLGGDLVTLNGPMLGAFALALVASLAVSLTVAPALASLLLQLRPGAREASATETLVLRHLSEPAERLLHSPRAVWTAAGLVAIFGLAALTMLRLEPLPTFKERDILIEGTGAPGSSILAMNRLTGRMVAELRAIPGVLTAGAQIGRAVTGDLMVGSDATQIWVRIGPAADQAATRAAIEQTIAGYPGFRSSTATYLGEVAGRLVPTTDEPVVVRIYGYDRAVLAEKAEEVRQLIARVPGVVAPRVAKPLEEAQVAIKVDLEKAAKVGLKPGDVRRVAATIFAGIEVGYIFEQQKIFDVVVWGTPEARGSVDKVKELLLDTPDGGRVRLADVAEVTFAPAPTVIDREGVSRYIDVRAGSAGRDLASVIDEVKTRVREIDYPLEYHPEVIEVPGAATGLAGRLPIAALVALAGMLLVLQAAFGSWRLAGLGVLGVVAAVIGGLIAAFASGGVVSIGSLVGLAGAAAFAARNGALMIDACQRLDGGQAGHMDPVSVLKAVKGQAVPTLTSAVAGALVVLPFALLGARTGLELLAPMAIAMLGGLLAAVLYTLLVLPTLCARAGVAHEVEAIA